MPSERDAPSPVTEWKGLRLSKFQMRAVEGIRAGRNVLVAAPTGAGKTLVAEYAMLHAVRLGRRCIYTSPIKALSNQKFRDFRDDPEVDVGIMTGDVTLHPHAQVLIMTTEILRNAIFENPGLLQGVEFVVFDEIHYMDDRDRGSVWEESLIFLPPEVRLICLSATISNVRELGGWLGEIRPQEIEVIRSTHRPVPLDHWLYSPARGAFPVSKLARIAKLEARERETRETREKNGPRARGARGHAGRGAAGGRRRGGRGRRGDEGPPDPRGLFDLLEERRLLPALVFSFSRRDCERLARQSEARELLDAGERRRMRELQDEIVRLFQLSERELASDLFQMTRRGVAYHHAGMLPIHKEVVERMFTAGLLKLLFTTETFALGINMPARSVVFQGLRKFDGVEVDWLRTRDYLQMAGRAGRQGIDEQGFVYSLVGPREILEAPLARLTAGEPEPVLSRFRLAYSTLLHLVEKLGRARVHEAWERSFNQYQARDKTERALDKHRRIQRRIVDAHLAMLDELGYLDGEGLTARGRVARALNGYELQVTEMLFRGVLEDEPPRALAAVFVGICFEDRRPFERAFVPARLLGDLRHRASAVVGELCALEARFGIQPAMKRPDWGLSATVLAWFDGAGFEELEGVTDATPGDVCRVFRMAIQQMRTVRRAIDADWDLHGRLREAVEALNRDEVDARRQLELG